MAVGRIRNRALAIAVALSLLVHGLAILSPAWRLPSDDATVLPPLDARLTPLPPPVLQPSDEKRHLLGEAPPPRPRPRPQARPPALPAGPVAELPADPAGAPELAGPASNDSAAPPTPDSATEAPPATPVEPNAADVPAGGADLGELWAASGKVQYNVIRGERNFIIGRTTHAWTHDKEHYSMETVIETVGLVGLIKPFRMVQRSEGRIGAHGLLPDKFTVERDGQVKERADFDWSTAKVVLMAGDRRREFDLAEGDQDVLSLMHQLSLQPDGPMNAELLVVTGKSAVRSAIRNLGLEDLEVPAGRVSAYHLGSTGHNGELKIDIWLAKDYANLPVRLKITDKNGDVLDQVATGVDLGPRADKK
ncbi:MAG TPA: DUF3108 domain-containing protein [Rhodocyclaceae bacterium]|nr:DUF3108 domain-containing protein [Rhodocyclaceae bacterium]